MDGLSDQLTNSNIGGNFGSGQLVNQISYADHTIIVGLLNVYLYDQNFDSGFMAILEMKVIILVIIHI